MTTNGSTTTRTFNAKNQATAVGGGTAPTYDGNGNTLTNSGQTFVYDAWDRLVAVKTTATGVTVAGYGYDALGDRITEAYSGTTGHLYYAPGGGVIEERVGGTASSNLAAQQVWGAASNLVLRDAYSGGTLTQRLYALRDANGDTTALVDTGGTVLERYEYSPYGAVTVLDAGGTPVSGNAGAYGWRYLFQAGRLDSASGLYLFGARDYNPSQGTWTERDPIGLIADLNEYRFVGNDPVDYRDPSGLQGFLGSFVDNFNVGIAAAGGFLQGGSDGIKIVANAFSGGQISSLNREVNDLIAENGGAYGYANTSAQVGAFAAGLATGAAGFSAGAAGLTSYGGGALLLAGVGGETAAVGGGLGALATGAAGIGVGGSGAVLAGTNLSNLSANSDILDGASGNKGTGDTCPTSNAPNRVPLRSRINETPKLVRGAESAGKSAQASLDRLVEQLGQGNLNPGIGTKPIGHGISEARARDGARVYFRQLQDRTIEILGKSTKADQSSVIAEVLNQFGG